MVKNARFLGASILLSVLVMLFFAGAVYTQGVGQNDAGSMMAERKKMMADMQAAEKRLDELVGKMNASRGTDKIDQIVAVVNELVATHKQMSRSMMSMPSGMMQRMQPGRQPNGSNAAPQSPDGPAADHREHHP
jgi:hypothetical protein